MTDSGYNRKGRRSWSKDESGGRSVICRGKSETKGGQRQPKVVRGKVRGNRMTVLQTLHSLGTSSAVFWALEAPMFQVERRWKGWKRWVMRK